MLRSDAHATCRIVESAQATHDRSHLQRLRACPKYAQNLHRAPPQHRRLEHSECPQYGSPKSSVSMLHSVTSPVSHLAWASSAQSIDSLSPSCNDVPRVNAFSTEVHTSGHSELIRATFAESALSTGSGARSHNRNLYTICLRSSRGASECDHGSHAHCEHRGVPHGTPMFPWHARLQPSCCAARPRATVVSSSRSPERRTMSPCSQTRNREGEMPRCE